MRIGIIIIYSKLQKICNSNPLLTETSPPLELYWYEPEKMSVIVSKSKPEKLFEKFPN